MTTPPVRFLPSLCAALLLGGCATVDEEVPYLYELSAPAEKPVPIHVAFDTFVDNRPSSDRVMTESLTDVEQRVTSTVLRDFRASRVFASHGFPAHDLGVEAERSASATGDLILSGEIKRFYWKQTPNLLTYMPGLVIFFTGVDMPLWWVEAGAELKLTLVHPQTGEVVAEYAHADSRVISTGWKEWQDGRWGLELADSLKAVVDGLKEKIAADQPKMGEG